MKRVLCLCLAACLALGLLGSSAFAGNLTGVNPLANPFESNASNNSVNATTINNRNFYIPLGASALAISDGNLDATAASQLGNVDLQPSQMSDYTEYTSKFDGYSFEAIGGRAYLILRPKETVSGAFSMRMGLAYRSGGVVTTNTDPSYHQVIYGTIQPGVTGDGSITGFQASSPYTITENISVGTPLYYDIPTSGVFTFNGADTTLTQAKLTNAGIQVTSSNSNIAVALDYTSGCRIKVSANTNNTGTQTGTIKLTSSRFSGEHTLFNYTLTVTTGTVSNNKITGIDANARLGYDANGIWGRTGRNGRELPSGETLDNMTIHPGDIVTFEFNSDFFLWQNGKPNPSAWLTKSLISNGKITVKRTGSSSGTNVIDTLEIRYDNNRAYVYLKFKDTLSSNRDVDFSFYVALAYNGSVVSGSEALVAGALNHNYIEVYEGDEYVDLSGGEIAEAVDAVSRIDVYIGEGVTITVRMTKGKLYKGVASVDEISSSDQAALDKYPEIEYVYTLTTSGLSQSGNIVSFDLGDTFYAYDKDLNYLGRTNTKLPYSTKYYLSPTKLDIETEVHGAGDGDVLEVPSASTPGPNATGNGNFNPATGQ